MDHQLFQALTAVFALLISIIGALVMLWVKSIQETQKAHADQFERLLGQINSVALEVAKNYMPRSELEKKLDSIFDLLEDIRKEVRHA